MVESREDYEVSDFHVEEPDLEDKDPPGDQNPAAEGSLGAGKSAGGPEVPGQGATEAPGGFTGGPASGTGQDSELDADDVPDTSEEMPPGRKFGTPGITDGT